MKQFTLIPVCILAILLAPLLAQAQTFIPINTESASARAHFVKGVRALDVNRDDDARAHFDQAIKADGDFAAAHLYRANTATSGADFVAHLDHARALRESASGFVGLEIDIALAGMENDTETQLNLAENLVAMHPNNPRAHVLLGNMHQQQKETAKARNEFNTAIDLDGSFPLARKAIAASLLFDEPTNHGAARWAAQRYLNRTGDEADGYILLGDVYRAGDNFEQARDTYAKAADVDPTNSIAHSKRGHANTYLGDYAAARNDFKAAADVNPTPGGKAAMQNFGVNTYLYAGDADGGLEANDAVVEGLMAAGASDSEITFPMMNAYWQRAMIAMHYDRHDEAEAALNSRAEWIDKAIGQTNKPSWTNSMRADVKLWNGVLAAGRGDLKKARQMAAENKEMLKDETNPRRYEDNHHLMAAIASAEGNYDAAVEHLAHADVDWVWIKYQTAVANENAGNTEKAQEMYKEVASWNFNSISTALCRNDAAKKVTSSMSAN